MKKKVALSIAGATATLLGGWKLVRQLIDRDETPAGVGQTESVDAPGPMRDAPGPMRDDPGPVRDPEPTTAKKAAADEADPPGAADESSTKAELYSLASELDIAGRSKMSKAELLEAIRKAG